MSNFLTSPPLSVELERQLVIRGSALRNASLQAAEDTSPPPSPPARPVYKLYGPPSVPPQPSAPPPSPPPPLPTIAQ
eukprot:3081950-Prymnesium_polylepis.1